MNKPPTYTHPDVLSIGVEQGWADAITDPTQIDWPPLQAAAALWFPVRDGHPINPHGPTAVETGRNEMGHWGEAQAADAIVLCHLNSVRYVLLIERGDGHGWAIPGGRLDDGEDPLTAAIRELEEETHLRLPGATWHTMPVRHVPDPRESGEAWMVTWPAITHLGKVARLPEVRGDDDANQAVWVRADTYAVLVDQLDTLYKGKVFASHEGLLCEVLDRSALTVDDRFLFYGDEDTGISAVCRSATCMREFDGAPVAYMLGVSNPFGENSAVEVVSGLSALLVAAERHTARVHDAQAAS